MGEILSLVFMVKSLPSGFDHYAAIFPWLLANKFSQHVSYLIIILKL